MPRVDTAGTGGDAAHKISIIPRGIAALGHTLQLPTEDRFLMTKAELEKAMRGHVLAEAQLVGTYEKRKGSD